MNDSRAAQIAIYLTQGNPTQDAIRAISYSLEQLENSGNLEIFVSEEIDDSVARPQRVLSPWMQLMEVHCGSKAIETDSEDGEGGDGQ